MRAQGVEVLGDILSRRGALLPWKECKQTIMMENFKTYYKRLIGNIDLDAAAVKHDSHKTDLFVGHDGAREGAMLQKHSVKRHEVKQHYTIGETLGSPSATYSYRMGALIPTKIQVLC